MKKYYFIISLLLISASQTLAQDGVFKSKLVQLSFAEIALEDQMVNLELYQVGVFLTTDFEQKMGARSLAKYNPLNGVYTLSYSMTAIGGGSDNRLRCPMLFVKLDFLSKDNQPYFRLIPISLVICETSQIREIEVLHIDLSRVLEEPDEIIEVRENGSYVMVPKEGVILGSLVKIERKPSFY